MKPGDRIQTKSGDIGKIVPAPGWGPPYHAFVLLDDAPKPNPRWILREAIVLAPIKNANQPPVCKRTEGRKRVSVKPSRKNLPSNHIVRFRIFMEVSKHLTQQSLAQNFSAEEPSSFAAIALGVPELLQNCIDNPGWSAETDWVKAFAAKVRAHAGNIKSATGFNVHAKMSDCAIVGTVLNRFGKFSTQSEQRTVNGKRRRFYSLDSDSLARLKEFLRLWVAG